MDDDRRGKATAAALAAALQLPRINEFVDARRECSGGCGDKGHCNYERGACECAWPWTGQNCETDPLSLCYDSPNSTMPSCGTYVPKSCQCYAQCANFYCWQEGDQRRCSHALGLTIGEARCFVRAGSPREEQHSYLPRRGDKTYQWHRVPHDIDQAWADAPSTNRLSPDMEWVCWDPWSRRDAMVYAEQLDECPGRCSDHGACLNETQHKVLRCSCRKGFKGDKCDEPAADDELLGCWFSPTCSGNGECVNGFCRCRDGFWGLDCSRSHAFALADGARAVPPRTALRIYMYDIPSSIVFSGDFDDNKMGRDRMYTAYESFIKMFLQDWSIRTENPHEANLFYIPALLYFYTANVFKPGPHIQRVVEYVSTEFPFWNRTRGKDHFFWLTADHGACALSGAAMDHAIKVTHFGLSGPARIFHYDLDPDYACLRPERDVVTPPVALHGFVADGSAAELFSRVLASGGDDGRSRDVIFFFAGGVPPKGSVTSGGARQAILEVLEAHAGDPEYADVVYINGRTGEYEALFLRSKFCIAPYGYGWGLRLAIAVQHGCLPVVTQDHVWQPFEELLPYERFSVRVSNADVPNIVPILRAFSDEQIRAMRVELAHHWRAFLWQEEVGGLAYNYTMAALKKRVYNLAAEYYRH